METDKDITIYCLTVEDAQTVAEKEIDRELTLEEVQKVKDLIAEKIDWYEALAQAIDQVVLPDEKEEG